MKKRLLILVILGLGLSNSNLTLSTEDSVFSRASNWLWPTENLFNVEENDELQDVADSNSEEASVDSDLENNEVSYRSIISEFDRWDNSLIPDLDRRPFLDELYCKYQSLEEDLILYNFLFENTRNLTGLQIKGLFNLIDKISLRHKRLYDQEGNKILNKEYLHAAVLVYNPEIKLNKNNYKFLIKTFSNSSGISEEDLDNLSNIIYGCSAKQVKELFDTDKLQKNNIISEDLYAAVYDYLENDTNISYFKVREQVLNYYAREYQITFSSFFKHKILRLPKLSSTDIKNLINRAYIEASSLNRTQVLEIDILKAFYGRGILEDLNVIYNLFKSCIIPYKINFNFKDLVCIKRAKNITIDLIEQVIKEASYIIQNNKSKKTIGVTEFVVAFYKVFDYLNPNLEDRIRILNYYLKESQISYANQDSVISLAKELNNVTSLEILEIIESAKDKSFNKKLYLSNMLKVYQEYYVNSNRLDNKKLDPSLSYVFLKAVAKKCHVNLNNNDLKSLAQEELLTFNELLQDKNISALLKLKRKEFLFNRKIKNAANNMILSCSKNLFQFKVSQQEGLDCGYHALLNGMSILDFINSGYNHDNSLDCISLYSSNFNINLIDFKNRVRIKRIKDLVSSALYNHFLLKLKGASKIEKIEGNSKSLCFKKGYVKLEPTERGWILWRKYIDDNVAKIIDILRDLVNSLVEEIKIIKHERNYYQITKDKILEIFAEKVKDINKDKYKSLLNKENIEKCFSSLEDFLINISNNSLTLSIYNPGDSRRTYTRAFSLTLDDIDNQFNSRDSYLVGEMLSGKEIEKLAETYKSDNFSILCLGDGIEISEHVNYSEFFKDLVKNIKEKEKYSGIIILHINGNHWITLVVDKNTSDIKYFVADSLNQNRLADNSVITIIQEIDRCLNDNLNNSDNNKDCVIKETIKEHIAENSEDLKEEIKHSEYTELYHNKLDEYSKAFFKPKYTFNNIAKTSNVSLKQKIDDMDAYFNTDFENKMDSGIFNLLLYGEPGTGKTTIAQAIADCLNRLYIEVNVGELLNSYKNSGSQCIKALFDAARKQDKPVVICIDEINAVVNNSADSSNNVNNDVANEINNQINIIESSEQKENKIIVIATTNYNHLIMDSLRDRFIEVEVNLPNAKEKIDILKCLLNINHDISEEYIETLANKKTKNWSIRDLKKLCGLAGINRLAILNNQIKNGELNRKDITSEMQRVQEYDFEQRIAEVQAQVNAKHTFGRGFNKWCFKHKETLNNTNTICSIASLPLNVVGSICSVGELVKKK